MHICYVLLSPTFGMHQYTADIANRMAEAGHDVHLVTTSHLPGDRYAPGIAIHAPVATTNTGLSLEALSSRRLRATGEAIRGLRCDVVHFTGPHVWNVPLIRMLRSQGIPVVHTLHDLDPHQGTGYGIFLKVWNWLVIRSADHILIHGQTYWDRLAAMGTPPSRMTYTPLLHLFIAWPKGSQPDEAASRVTHEPWALFFGRLERYKGVDHLLTALAMLDGHDNKATKAILAGPGKLSMLWAGPLPDRVEVRNRFIDDEEAVELFRRCGLLVLPYLDATQSALIAGAYYFQKPVVVTRSGALPEYVVDGVTGRIVERDHPVALSRCIEELLDDPERLARMGAAGRAWYDTRRLQETQSLAEMYQRLVST